MGSSARALVSVLDLTRERDRRRLRKAIDIRRTRSENIVRAVRSIVDDVRVRGDRALFGYAKRFDRVPVSGSTVRLDPREFRRVAASVPREFRQAVRGAIERLRAYHRHQGMREFTLRTGEGVLEQRVLPIGRVGLYVPGGYTIYPSTVLMNVVPAQVAGVREIAVVTPCKGGLDPALAHIFDCLGITEVYRIGGAHAIAALAYGTASVPRVDKIFGPGNSYVTAAKKLVFGDVDIDSLAGPSEVVILADRSARPDWVALDLLSQAEHGTGDEMAFCVTEDRAFGERVRAATVAAITRSPVRKVFANLAPCALSVCVCRDQTACIDFVNEVAPEHLQIMTRSPRRDLETVRNAAAVFIGPYSPVPLGDYYIGTNHVLPTAGAARFGSPLGVPAFQKRMSVAEVTPAGIRRAARPVAVLARTERFEHHALAVEARL